MVRYIGFYKIQCVLVILYFSQVSICPQGGACLWSWEVSASGPWGGGGLPLVLGDVCLWSQGGVCLWSEGCLPLPGQTPPRQTPPRQTPPAQCMLGYTPTCPVHAGIHTHTPCPVQAWIWSTNGQYGSHWNAFLFIILMLTVGMAVNIYVAPKHENICFTV